MQVIEKFNDTSLKNYPGYPVWLLATLSKMMDLMAQTVLLETTAMDVLTEHAVNSFLISLPLSKLLVDTP